MFFELSIVSESFVGVFLFSFFSFFLFRLTLSESDGPETGLLPF